MSFVMFFLSLFMSLSNSQDDVKKCYEECSPNEVFAECQGSCQPYCGSSFADSVSNLNCGCVHGCICKPNLIRSNITGKCGPIKRCKKLLIELNATSLLCGENEHFTETNAGCQLSCYTLHDDKKNCHEARGCICNENYVRDTRSGKCIEVVKCPNCRPNEEWIPCSNCTTIACQLSCGSCKCRAGYVSHKNHCIRDCLSRYCGVNEEFLKCSNCENCCFDNPRTTCDSDGCYSGCFCIEPFVRNPLSGKCVPYEKCPPRCQKHERFGCQSRACEVRCEKLNQTCASSPSAECQESCYCRNSEGYVRHANGSCIHYAECSN